MYCWKRFLTLLTALAMLASLVLPAAAVDGEQMQTITCGQVIEPDLSESGCTLQFTPEVDGWYCLYAEMYDAYFWGEIYDANGEILACDADAEEVDDCYMIKLPLTAGQTYSIEANWGDWGGGYLTMQMIHLTVPMQSLNLDDTEMTGYAGEKLWLEYSFSYSPLLSIPEKITWTSSDEAVATVDETGYVQLLSDGTAVIAVASESGLTASCTVTVDSMPSIICGVPVEPDFEDGSCELLFIPENDGWYGFYSSGTVDDPSGSITKMNSETLEHSAGNGIDQHFMAKAWLTAGEQYVLDAYWGGDEDPDEDLGIQLHVDPLTEKATSIVLTDSEKTVGIDEYLDIDWWFLPLFSIPEEVTCESSDETVATVTDYGYMDLLSPGTTVITVTSETGLTASCTVTVEGVPTITCGQPVVPNVEDGECTLQFIPETDGWYGFYSTGENVNIWGRIEASNGNTIADDYRQDDPFVAKVWLTAGETYFLKVDWDAWDDGFPTLHVAYLTEAAEAVSISEQQISGFPGDGHSLECDWQPFLCVPEQLFWTSSDETVATVDSDGYVRLLSAGTAVITVTTQKGLSATCEVTVKGVPTIICDVPVEPNLEEGECQLAFTPEADGWYCFYSTGFDVWTTGEILDVDQTKENRDSHFLAKAWLCAGETYQLYAEWEDYGDGELLLHVTPLTQAATALILSNTQISGYPGECCNLWIDFEPSMYIPEKVSWTSSDQTVATVNKHGEVELVSAGTAVITATSENGLIATCQVTVKGVPSITCGQVVELDPEEEDCVLQFAPETDGWYGFWSSGDGVEVWGGIRDVEDFTDTFGDHFISKAQLTAGEVYELYVSCSIEDWSQDRNLQVQIAPLTGPLEAVTLSQSELTGRVGDYPLLTCQFQPFLSYPEEVTWSSSNESVVTVSDAGWVDMLSVGTAVITVTTENGLTASCQVTVNGIPTITCGQVLELNPEDEKCELQFIPETDGWYGFCVNASDLHVWGQILDQYGGQLASESGDGAVVKARLEAGETYRLRAEWWYYGEGSISLEIVPLTQAAESITLSYEKIEAYAGDDYYLEYELQPSMCIPEGVIWTSSDETVATVSSYGTVELLSAGTAMITTTSKNGLTATCWVTVKDVPTITCGQVVKPNMDDRECRLTFVPETSGWYCFYAIGEGRDSYLEILYEECQIDQIDDDCYTKAWLTAGYTYYLNASWGDIGEGSLSLQIAPVTEAAESIQLSETEITGYPYDAESIECFLLPYLCIPEEVTWESSDETVATVDDYGYVEMHTAGTALITVTTENGLTAACQVTVKPAISIICGQVAKPDPDDEDCTLEFTPRADGWYCFYSNGGCDASLYIEGVENQSQQIDGNCYTKAQLTAGMTYYLRAWWDVEKGPVTLQIAPVTEAAESIQLSETEITGYPYDAESIECFLLPYLCIPEEATWESSNEAVATVNDYGYGSVELHSPGTAVITVTSENGLSASCLVTVKDIPTILCGQVEELNKENPRRTYCFVPETDGMYRISATGSDRDAWVYIYNANWESIDGIYDMDPEFEVMLTAGNTYYIKVGCSADSESNMSFRVVSADQEQTTVTLSGSVTTFTDGETTLELVDGNGIVQTVTVNGKTGSYELTNVPVGDYTLYVSKENHVTRSYAISAADSVMIQDVKLCLIGDTTGDGKVNVADTSKAYAHARGSNLITDEYALACADVTGDGKINMGDLANIYARIRKTK